MKSYLSLFFLAALALPAYAADTVDAGLEAVNALGAANGQALACEEKNVVTRARMLMLLHVPKTARFGDAFEAATRQGFMAQVQSAAACPDSRTLGRSVEDIADRLKAVFPTAN